MLFPQTLLLAVLTSLATGQEMRSGAMISVDASAVSSAQSVLSMRSVSAAASASAASASAASVSASASAAATAVPKPAQTGAASVNDVQYAAMVGGAAAAILNAFV